MKKLLIIILWIIISVHYATAQCQYMAETEFQNAKYRLSTNRGNINTFQSAMDLTRTYCLTSNQAREFANFLANDRDKFDFLKASFIQITDKENFTDVMDVFRLFSSAIKLYHQTLGAAVQTLPVSSSANPNCTRNMSSANFNLLRNQIAPLADDRQKASSILNAGTECMTTQQIMQLVKLLRDENIRLDVLKRLYPIVYDRENYQQASSILSPEFRNHFILFLQNPNQNSTNINTTTDPIGLSEIDFKNFLASIQKQSFEKDKDLHIRTYMKNAFMTTSQIKQVVKLLTFDATRLDIAKYLFDRCIDKQNYFQIADELQFSSSKTNLNEYVKSRL